MARGARPISHRIRAVIMAITLSSLGLMLALGWWAQESMEAAILQADQRATADMVLALAVPGQPLLRQTEDLIAYFKPAAEADAGLPAMPPVFANLSVPASLEREHDGQTYLISATSVAGGALYLAKNISAFESQVGNARSLFLALGAFIVALALALAQWASTRLVRPLRQLTGHIQSLQPRATLAAAPTNQPDLELRAIAESFNRFLEAQTAFVRREQSLVSLASHELRTPTAVISGALEIVAHRGHLAPDDQRTLARAQHATDELRQTIDLILRLGRASPLASPPQILNLARCVSDVLDDLTLANHPVARIAVQIPPDCSVLADPLLVKILVRNLVHNALHHTAGQVSLRADNRSLSVTDEGGGLPEPYNQLLNSTRPAPASPTLTGLGLLIVTLITERLGWALQASNNPERGITVTVRWA